MEKTLKFLFLIAFVHSATSLLANPKSIKPCPGKKNLMVLPSKTEHVNRTHVAFSGRIYLPYTVDDNTEINVKIAIKSAEVWKENFFNFQMKNGCKDVKNVIPEFLIRLGKSSNTTYKGGCPVPKGDMYVTRMVPTTSLSIPIPPKGEFRATVTFAKDGSKYACFLVDFDLSRS